MARNPSRFDDAIVQPFERTKPEESVVKLVAALAGILANGDFREPEYERALTVLKEVTGFQGPWYDVDVRALRRVK